jgi:hypothetical protein
MPVAAAKLKKQVYYTKTHREWVDKKIKKMDPNSTFNQKWWAKEEQDLSYQPWV